MSDDYLTTDLHADRWAEEAGRSMARWADGLMRQLDPRELCHCILVTYKGRPFYYELHLRGQRLGSWEWKIRGVNA